MAATTPHTKLEWTEYFRRSKDHPVPTEVRENFEKYTHRRERCEELRDAVLDEVYAQRDSAVRCVEALVQALEAQGVSEARIDETIATAEQGVSHTKDKAKLERKFEKSIEKADYYHDRMLSLMFSFGNSEQSAAFATGVGNKVDPESGYNSDDSEEEDSEEEDSEEEDVDPSEMIDSVPQ